MTDTEQMIYDTCVRIEEKVEIQNGRVRALENWRSYLTGAIVLLGALGGIYYK